MNMNIPSMIYTSNQNFSNTDEWTSKKEKSLAGMKKKKVASDNENINLEATR